MDTTELIEALRKEAPKFGMTEEEFFAKTRDTLRKMQDIDISSIMRAFVEQQERMSKQRTDLTDTIAQGTRKTHGALKFPL